MVEFNHKGKTYMLLQLYIGNSLKSREKWEKNFNKLCGFVTPPICLKKGGYTIISTHGGCSGNVIGWDGKTSMPLNEMLQRRNIRGKVILDCCHGTAVEKLYLQNGGDPKKVIFLNQTDGVAIGIRNSFENGYITFTGVIPTPKLLKQLKGTPLRIK